jgi:general secretion pathway protein E
MGTEPFLLSSTIAGVLAQRLVRRLCPACKEPYAPDEAERRLLGLGESESALVYRPTGCARCGTTGYEGRVGVYEMMVVDDRSRTLIHEDAGEQTIAAHAFREADTLATCGFRHVLAGVTSIEEVLRVVKQDDDDAVV